MTRNDSSPTTHAALITGAAHRLGAVIARALHQAGLRVVIHHHTASAAARQLVAELNRIRPDSAVALSAALDNLTTLPDLVDRTVQRFGRLDLLVNNAARFFPTPLAETGAADWDTLINTNLRAPFFLAQAAAPHLRATRGAIVNIVDLYADRPLAEHPVYCATKAALVSLTRSLARDLAPDVRVNAVAPGAILWPQAGNPQSAILARTPLARRGNPLDIARAVRYLGLEAGFVTGQVLSVDGGRSVMP